MVKCQERARTSCRSNTCHLKDQSSTKKSTMCRSKAGPEKADRREAQSERTTELERGHREAAQLQELRDMLSCAKSEQQALSQKEAKHQSHLGKVQDGTNRHLVILNVKDDQKIFQDDALPRHMRRVIPLREMRTTRDHMLVLTTTRPLKGQYVGKNEMKILLGLKQLERPRSSMS